MKKSFFSIFDIRIFILFVFIIPLTLFAQVDEYGNSTEPLPLPGENTPYVESESPINEDNYSGGVLPPLPGSDNTSTDLSDTSNQGETQNWENPSNFNTGSNTNNPTNGNTPTYQQQNQPFNNYQPTTQNSPITAGRNIPALDSLVNPNSSNLNFGDQPLSKILNQMFFVGLVIVVILAIVMIIRGGVEYMTIDAISSKESGKNRVKAALGGLTLAFSAILILNTINPSITDLKIVFPTLQRINPIGVEGINLGSNITPTAVNGWSKDENGNYIKKQSDGSTLVSTPDGKNYTIYPDGSIKPGLTRPDGTTAPLLNGQDEKSVRDYFAQNNIAINAQQGITNVEGLGESAMRGVVDLKNASGANITITGGTEPGHKTHGVGKSIVDLRKDATLNSYITNNATANYPRAGYTEYRLPNGTTYMDEGDHWHVEFK